MYHFTCDIDSAICELNNDQAHDNKKIGIDILLNDKEEVPTAYKHKYIYQSWHIYTLEKVNDDILTKVIILTSFEQIKKDFTLHKLIEFHASNKYLLMSYHPDILKKMGRIIANSKHELYKNIITAYEEKLKHILNIKRSYQTKENAYTHIYGYFKKDISASNKSKYFDLLEQYRQDKINDFDILSLLYQLTKKYHDSYLLKQTIFMSLQIKRN